MQIFDNVEQPFIQVQEIGLLVLCAIKNLIVLLVNYQRCSHYLNQHIWT